MAKVISQDTFDGAVRENIEEFAMSTEEAISDAVKQFESQGVNLQNIVTNSLLTSEVDALSEKVKTLKELVKDSKNPEFLKILKELKEDCGGDIAKKILLAKCGMYETLVNFLISDLHMESSLKNSVIESLISLMTGYPDLLEETGISVLEYLLNNGEDHTLLLTIQWIIECCTKHEKNREKFLINDTIIKGLKKNVNLSTSPDVLRNLCKLFQTFVLSDDIRTEFPMAHKHACQLCNEFLDTLILCLQKYQADKRVLLAVIQALSAIIVRNEYCQRFMELDGLDYVRDIMVAHLNDEVVCRSCFSLIKVVSGNDQVKARVMEVIDASIFLSIIHKYLSSVKACSQGLAALNMLTLRNTTNCKALYDGNVAELLVQAIKVHSSSKKILKTVCWIIKNLSNGNEKIVAEFLNLGAQDCLQAIVSEHEDCKFEVNVALRLLGCDVECVELWTGEGKGISH